MNYLRQKWEYLKDERQIFSKVQQVSFDDDTEHFYFIG